MLNSAGVTLLEAWSQVSVRASTDGWYSEIKSWMRLELQGRDLILIKARTLR